MLLLLLPRSAAAALERLLWCRSSWRACWTCTWPMPKLRSSTGRCCWQPQRWLCWAPTLCWRSMPSAWGMCSSCWTCLPPAPGLLQVCNSAPGLLQVCNHVRGLAPCLPGMQSGLLSRDAMHVWSCLDMAMLVQEQQSKFCDRWCLGASSLLALLYPVGRTQRSTQTALDWHHK